MSAQRPHKIALIGATGYERQAPQRIDCLRWERLPGECNLRDYDTIILNLRSRAVPGGVDWHAFQRVLSFAVAREILESNGRIIILGDPRFSVCTSAKRDTGDATHSVPFLSWTGLVFDWDDQSGDTIAVRDLYRYDLYQEYLRSLKTWRYSLKDCEVDPATWQTVYDLATLRKEGIGLVLKKEILCANR